MTHPAKATTNEPDEREAGIRDLFAQLFRDAKELVRGEARLARLETSESIARAGRGALWLGLAFAVVVVMVVAFTLFLTTLIGRMVNGHHWIGALVTGALELVVGALLVKRGLRELSRAPYSLPETRASLKRASSE